MISISSIGRAALGVPCAFTLALSACGEAPPSAASEGDRYHVYFLGGQSNMDGYGFNADLPEELTGEIGEVLIFHGETVADGEAGAPGALWKALGPGHGAGFASTDDEETLSARFGPELSFGHELSRLDPDAKIAIVKYARGGTALVDGVSGYGSWDPRGHGDGEPNQLNHAEAVIEKALATADLDGDGQEDLLIPAGIVWMQGEADAFDDEEASSQYADHLGTVMERLRTALGSDVPIVLGRIQDSGDSDETRVMRYSPVVQAQQELFAERDPCVSLVEETEGFSFLPDGWHYRSEHYVTLGKAFAREMEVLRERCAS